MRVESRVPVDGSPEGGAFAEFARRAANHVGLAPTTFLERAAAVYPRKPAVIHDVHVFTYAELRGRARRLASAWLVARRYCDLLNGDSPSEG